jgi:hypothetical protein
MIIAVYKEDNTILAQGESFNEVVKELADIDDFDKVEEINSNIQFYECFKLNTIAVNTGIVIKEV